MLWAYLGQQPASECQDKEGRLRTAAVRGAKQLKRYHKQRNEIAATMHHGCTSEVRFLTKRPIKKGGTTCIVNGNWIFPRSVIPSSQARPTTSAKETDNNEAPRPYQAIFEGGVLGIIG